MLCAVWYCLYILTLPGLGGPGYFAMSNILMELFIDLSNWSKISWLFLKFTWEKFFKYFCLVISVTYCWRHHFSTKVILVKLKMISILMQWSQWFIFWNILLYCKIIINFLELRIWWRHQMMKKVIFVNFLSRLVPCCQYSICTKYFCKMDKNVLRCSIIFNCRPASPSPPRHSPDIFKKAQPR